ncbi:MAG: cation:proton antiporter [Nitrospirae bacterium]|nr:cation:proton antiporter [Nitrospirota bacterium]
MEISFVFLIAGLIIIIGFFGGVSFERTKIPDVLVLLGIGVVLGPLFGLVDPKNLTRFAEYFGSLALMIILFEGGMDMDLKKLMKEFGTASLLVMLSFVLSTLSIAGFLFFIESWDILRSLLLGTILGCTSAAIVIPVIGMMSLKEEIKTILSVESAFSDVFAVIFTVSLIEFVQLETKGIDAPFRAVASSFSIAIVLGVASGLFWLKILDIFKDRKYSYMTTLAAMLIVYALVNFLGGSGPISILIFGIILGNCTDLAGFLKLKTCSLVDVSIKFLHGEVTFFIRTFFFVYMGMMISFSLISRDFLALSLALVLIILLVRYISVFVIALFFQEKKRDRFVMLSMLPRGLASAVLATLPATANIIGTEHFTDYTFAVIVMTNILMTTGVFFVSRKNGHPLLKAGGNRVSHQI